jgi:tetratricopeptide (TPR) repeat protein
MIVLTLGEKIKNKRNEMNMTLKDLAGDRITQGQISLVESGKSNPSIDLLEYIAEKLNTDLEYFLESEEKQAARICEFYVNIAEASLNSGHLQKTREAIEKGKYYSDKYKMPYFRGILDMIFAEMKYSGEEYEEAERYCLTANIIFLRNDNLEYTLKSFILLGHIAYGMGNINTALNYFIQCDEIIQENNYVGEFFRAMVFYNIALCYNKIGDMIHSIDYAMFARERLEVLNNRKEYANTLMLIGVSYSEENNIKEALKYTSEAKKIYGELSDIHEMSDIETNLGVIFDHNDNMDEAFVHFDNALKLKGQINDDTIADTHFKMCDSYTKLKNYDKALEIVNKVFDIISDEQHLYRVKCYEYLFAIYNQIGEKSKAEEALVTGIRYLEKLDYKKHLANLYSTLGKFYNEIGEKELALGFVMKGLDLYKELGVI